MQKSICLITFSNLKTDGRSLNLLRVLSSEYEVFCISQTKKNDYDNLKLSKNIKHLYIEKKHHRMLFNWLNFSNQAKKLKKLINANIYWACDLYSLKTAIDLIKDDNFLLYDSREIYSALGNLYKSKLKQYILAYLEKKWINKVDHFIVSGDLDAEYLKKYFNTQKPFTTILNVPYYKEALKSSIIRDKYPFLNEKIILLYQGAVHHGRGIEPMLNFLEKRTQYAMVIIGDGIFLNEAKLIAQKKKILDRVVFVGSVEYDDLHKWTCSADIGLNLIEPISFSYELALPNKMFEYAMAGVPQLASSLPAIAQIIKKHEFGVLIYDFSDTSIENGLQKILENYNFYKENSIKAARIFNYENETQKILDLIKNI